MPSSAGMGHDTTIYDTTLRDGCQGAGISLALRDKLDIARRLDEVGIDYVEGGWPGSNPKDAEFFESIRERPLRHARVTAFGSTQRAGIAAADDDNLRLLLAAETPTVALVAKAWDFHVTGVLRTTLEENLAMVGESVAFAKAAGREVVFDAEHFFDGHRSNAEYALAVLNAAAEAGADWLVLCDTNGGSLPDRVAQVVGGGRRGVRHARRHPRTQRRQPGGRQLARRGRRRRAAGPGDDQRLRRAGRQREPLLDHPEPRPQDGPSLPGG